MARMSAGGQGGKTGQSVDWDSVLNLTMKEIRTKDIYQLRQIVCSDRYSDETREKVRRLVEHVEPPQTIPWEMIQLMNCYQLQDILDNANRFSIETTKVAAEFLDTLPYNERYPLHHAIYTLDMEQVKDLLTEYSTINERDSSYWTPLHIVSMIGSRGDKETRAQVVMMRLLISLGADINARDMMGRTPIWITIDKGFCSTRWLTAAQVWDSHSHPIGPRGRCEPWRQCWGLPFPVGGNHAFPRNSPTCTCDHEARGSCSTGTWILMTIVVVQHLSTVAFIIMILEGDWSFETM